MGVAAVIHIHVFPADPYKHGERCERNVAVMADYACLEAPPDPEEVQDCERSPTLHVSLINEEEETHPKIHQSVCDVVLGSGGIVRPLSFSLLLSLEQNETSSCPPLYRHVYVFSFAWRLVVMQMVDDMKFTVSHVVEPVERGLCKLNRTFHDISENIKKKELHKKSKDDSCLVPFKFSNVEGSVNDSSLSRSKRPKL